MKKGEIWFVEIPGETGREQRGLRPVVLMSDIEAGTVMAVPFTSNVQALKYWHTLEILPSIENGLKSSSVALVFQLRAIDVSRLRNRIGILEKSAISEIERLTKDLLRL